MKITTTCCSTIAMLFIAPFVNGQIAAGAGVVTTASVATPAPVTPAPPTMVWVTSTFAAGPSTFTSPFTQTFSSFNGQISSPLPGTIGLGSISGEIGHTQTVHKRSSEPTVKPAVLEKRSNNEWFKDSREHPRRW